VLRLNGERAEKKVAHWQSVAVSACEQCGGNRVPRIWPVAALGQWLHTISDSDIRSRCLLSLAPGSLALAQWKAPKQEAIFLSGPEGGWSRAEEDAALTAGFAPVSLGSRVLRSETAALTALAALTSRA